MSQTPLILVVDDDAASCDIAARLLERQGYRTRRAASGPECLKAVEHEPVDLILLDVMMPGMDGFEVCEALRALPAGRGVPVILLTARAEQETRERLLREGAQDYVKEMVTALGGQIELDSEAGVGSTFSVSLPAAASEPASA